MANVVGNNKDAFYLGMVVAAIPKDDKITVHAVNPKIPTSDKIPCFPTGTRYHDCSDAVKRKGGKEWVPGKFVDGIPLNGTPIQLKFPPWRTENGTEWKVEWLRIDGYNYSDGTMRDR